MTVIYRWHNLNGATEAIDVPFSHFQKKYSQVWKVHLAVPDNHWGTNVMIGRAMSADNESSLLFTKS